jgi:hypothetical protein
MAPRSLVTNAVGPGSAQPSKTPTAGPPLVLPSSESKWNPAVFDYNLIFSTLPSF